MIEKSISDRYKQIYLYQVLKCDDIRSASALHTYAIYLNKLPKTYDRVPLYLKVFQSNNKFAVDALLKGHDPEGFFDYIRVANPYVIQEIFSTFHDFKRNTLSPKTLRVFLRFLKRFYSSAKEGYLIYPLTVSELNSMAKYLDESKDQSDELNREILDILSCFTELADHYETDIDRITIGQQSGRIRSDFFDENRTLKSSFPRPLLEKERNVDEGIQPETFSAD